jgi:hypothetical protein
LGLSFGFDAAVNFTGYRRLYGFLADHVYHLAGCISWV